LVFATTTLIGFFAAADGSAPWWDYPGLELWKFLNLIVFILIARYLLGKPLQQALRARSESIKQELRKAREERDSALAKLSEVEARLVHLDEETAAIKAKAQVEAEAEKQRLRIAMEIEITRIREQATREIDSAAKTARHELRKFAADESVRIAESILRKEIKPEDDSRLANLNVQELGRIQA